MMATWMGIGSVKFLWGWGANYEEGAGMEKNPRKWGEDEKIHEDGVRIGTICVMVICVMVRITYRVTHSLMHVSK